MSMLLRQIGALIYPWPFTCLCCGGRSGGNGALCPECADRLRGQRVETGFAGDGFEMSVAAHMYAGPAGALVRALKYRALSALADAMGRDMLNAAADAGMGVPDVVTFVPMHWRRRRTRYFNHAELLAGKVAREWNMKPEKALKRVRECRQQAGISEADARRENVRNAFAARRGLKGQRVLLIDDVFTTGATARECARALRKADAAEVWLLVYSLAGHGRDAGA